MLKIKLKELLFFISLLFAVHLNAQEWTNLIDEDLSKWELWMGVPHVTTGLPGATSTTGINGGSALGLGNDPLNVFSVINEGGELQLKITGEVYGGLTTLQEYSDYHFSVQFRWGEDKFEPRLDAKRDSGILYHCKGPHGAFWNVWKSCLELQVQETDCGDFFGLAGCSASIQSQGGVFRPGGNLAVGGSRIRKSENFENPHGEWNTLEVITIGDRSMHFVNGNLVNALQNTTYNGAVLNDGQIQIQSEGAEIYYRDIKIRSVTSFPTDESILLGWEEDNGTEVSNGDFSVGNTVVLQKSGGDENYVTIASGSAKLIANTSNRNNAAEFVIESHPNGGIGLRNNETGRYLQVQGDDQALAMRAFGNRLGVWEQFESRSMGNGKIALRSLFTEKWVQASYNINNTTLFPVGAAAGTWETFNFLVVNDGGPTNPPTTTEGKVLVFHKTNGFRHSSIDDGIDMITRQGLDNGMWITNESNNSNVFTTENLAQYNVVVWCNTTGDDLLTSNQEAAFEEYIRNGGGFVGIHSSTDTYRSRSWPFYNDLVGGIVQTDPTHTNRNHNATMTVNEPSHPTVDFLGGTWNKTEEYYYWRNNGGQLYDGNINLLTVESTGNNNYDEARPIAWYKEYQGGRSFYTALGHNDSDYTGDDDFIRHVEEGIKWAGNFNDEVIVIPTPTGVNLALDGRASQSSTGFGGIASRAIDGNTNGEYFDGSVSHTNTQNNAWWQVELNSEQAIGEINIYNRVGCCEDRLSNFTVIITDSNNNETFSQTITTIPNPSLTVNAAGAIGNTVRIQSNITNTPLSLAEVEIFAGEENTLARIEAEDFDQQSGTQTEPSSEGTDNVGYINNNDWLKFEDINLTGMQSFDARVACRYTGGDIELRLGSPTGILLGTASVVNTGGNQVYETVTANIENVTGVNDIYFVFTGRSGFLFNVNWFEFSSTRRSSKDSISIDQIEVSVYPNPSEDVLIIENVAEDASLILCNVAGQIVNFSQSINETTRLLDIKSLTSGVYILIINGNSYKVVKN